MKNILAENMLRFGVKNLNNKSKKTIELIIEQSATQDVTNGNRIGDVLYTGTSPWNKYYGDPKKALIQLKKNPAYKDADEAKHNALVRQWTNELTAIGNYPLFLEGLQKHHTNNAKYWFKELTQDSRKSFLTYFNEWLNSQKPRIQKKIIKNKVALDIKLDRGKPVTTKIPGEPQPDIPGFSAPLSISGQTVYKDNSIEIDSALQQEIDRWVTEVQTAINSAKQVNPNATITCISAEIASSCSRLRNTKSAEGMTWKQLSKARAENVYKIITSRLQEIGVVISPQITKTLKGGYNGDGSSGPDPANKFTFDSGKTTTAMGYAKTGGELKPLSGPDANRYGADRYGKLLSTQAESHQYKFCMAIIDFVIKAPGMERPTEPAIKKERDYTIVIKWLGDIPGSTGTRKFPVPQFKRPKNKVKVRLDACPIF